MTSCPTNPAVKLLSLDFDDTCTTMDTTSLFYKATNKYRFGSEGERSRLDQEWMTHVNVYLTGYALAVDNAMSKLEAQKDFSGFNEQGVRDFLQELNEFSQDINNDIESGGIIQGITLEGIQAVAKEIVLQPHCLETLQLFKNYQVVSVNWSAELIHAKLGTETSKIHANSFPMHNGLSTGKLERSMKSAFDKERVFNKLTRESQVHGVSIFIGDSVTDLLALLAADVGIIVGKSSSLRKVALLSGIVIRPLQERGTASLDKSPVVLYESSSWEQIQIFLLSLNNDGCKKDCKSITSESVSEQQLLTKAVN